MSNPVDDEFEEVVERLDFVAADFEMLQGSVVDEAVGKSGNPDGVETHVLHVKAC